MKKKMGNERRMIEALALVCSLHVEILSDNDRSHHLGSVDDLVEEKLRNIDVMKELKEDTPKRHCTASTSGQYYSPSSSSSEETKRSNDIMIFKSGIPKRRRTASTHSSSSSSSSPSERKRSNDIMILESAIPKRRRTASTHSTSSSSSEERKRGKDDTMTLESGIPKRRRTSDDHHDDDVVLRVVPEETKVTRRNKSNNKRKRIRDDRDTSNTSKGGVIHGPNPPPPISEELAQVIRGMTNGDQLNLKLVIQRKLFQTDTLSRQNRLQMPRNQISSDNFLNDDEKKKLDQNEGIQVRFIQPNLEEENGLVFKRWKYKNVNCAGYVFNKNWHKGVVQKNGLECGQLVQVWFFRDKDGNPCFAMVNLG
ncbi:hypothetical protein F8388_000189 [Cannabis sativa]|uniref:B3 domain-containing protein n=1 Tax=Cannabis sativa TaxID=3483 RepID=A0A7J6F0J5_CANSA|nr:hypothetical protein F8388_000189 [Cannabis sativa]